MYLTVVNSSLREISNKAEQVYGRRNNRVEEDQASLLISICITHRFKTVVAHSSDYSKIHLRVRRRQYFFGMYDVRKAHLQENLLFSCYRVPDKQQPEDHAYRLRASKNPQPHIAIFTQVFS